MIVAKFGGTSVRDANAMLSVAEILRGRIATHGSVIGVVSATSDTTNTLLALASMRNAVAEQSLRSRHHAILTDAVSDTCQAHVSIDALCDELTTYLDAVSILGECTDESRDTVVAFGERLSTTILHAICVHHGINAELLDARHLVRTDATYGHAVVDMQTTRDQCAALRTRPAALTITQGFIGATSDHRTTTLGRGGSDYTAALLGWACNASVIEIWTDVSGIYTCDPRVIQDAVPIASLGFQQVRELALYGAKVIHPETIIPAVSASIPVRILHTFAPQEPGTTIIADTAEGESRIAAVSVLRGCQHIRASTEVLAHMRAADGLHDAVVVCADAIDTGFLVVRCTTAEHEQALVALCETHHIQPVPSGVLAVCSTGAWDASLIATAMHALQDCNVLATSVGSTLTALLTVISDHDVETAAQQIHAEIIRRR